MTRIPDDIYRDIYGKWAPRLCVSVVVPFHDCVALVRRTEEPYTHHWHLPGGRLCRGESLFAAATRVAKRELGIVIRARSILGAVESLHDVYENNLEIHNVDIVILAAPTDAILVAENAAWHARAPIPNVGNQMFFLVEHGYLDR